MGNGSVCVAYLHPGQVSGAFCDSLSALLMHDATHHRRILDGGGLLAMASGPLIASARNQIVERFLELDGEAEWLFFVDSDMTFDPDVLDRLVAVAVANRCPILGGLCFAGGRRGVLEPTMYRWEDDPDGGIIKQTITRWPPDALVEVGYTGCAALLIHREVLVRIGDAYPEPTRWFAYGVDPKTNVEYGEDAVFCKRAAACGFAVHVFTGIAFGHTKTYTWTAADYERQRESEAAVPAPVLPMNRQARRAAERKKEASVG